MNKRILTTIVAMAVLFGANAQSRKGKDAAPVVTEWNDVEIFEQHKLYPRANVIPYGDENAIEKNGYTESPYYVSLSKGWQMTLSSSFSSRPTDMEQKSFSPSGWPSVTSPTAQWQERGKTVLTKKVTKPADVSESGNYVATYYRNLDVPKSWKEYKAYLNIQARSAFYVWVNHEYAGYSEDSRDISEFDITKHLKPGKPNSIVVQVIGTTDGNLLESQYARSLNGITSTPFIILKPVVDIMDYKILADYNNGSKMGSLTVDIDVYNEMKKGQYYVEMEVWDTKGHQVEKMGRWTVFDKKNELTMKMERSIAEVEPWSAETPNMYTIVLRLRDQKMNLLETVGCRFGFRSIKLKDGLLTVNGAPITINGATYVLYDYETHSLPSREQVKEDLKLMKRNNINAVRTTLYSPAEPWFYELCDEYGLYVVSDANIQPLSTTAKAVATDKEYINMFVTRMQNMYERLKNHPSIIAWSLGNTQDNGICMENAFRTIKQKDKSRLVLYPGAGYSDNSDVVVPMYIEYDDLKLYAAKQQSKPLIMSAFGSSKGNSYGNMEPFWKLVRDNSSLQGGFACHWNAYDYFDPMSGNDLHTEGLVGGDRQPSPMLSELRNIYRPFDVKMVNISPDAAEFNVTNYLAFLTLNDYILEYNIYSNLKPRIIEGEVSVDLKPGESKNFKLKIPALTLYAGEELFIRFTIKQRAATEVVPRGTELGVVEFKLPMKGVRKEQLADYDREDLLITRSRTGSDSVDVSLTAEDGGTIHVFNDNIDIIYDLDHADIQSYSYHDKQVLVSAPRINFWRAATDNDRVDKNGMRMWQGLNPSGLTRTVIATNYRRVDNNTVCIDAMLRYSDRNGAVLFDVKQSMSVLFTGDVIIDNEIVASEQIKNLPKVGLQMCLPKNMDSVRWFGLDKESYIDRRQSGVTSTYKSHASTIFHTYERPQEAGNRAGVRWVSVEDKNVGFYVDMLDSNFNFSIYPYTDVDLYEGETVSSLKKRDFWTFNVDYRQAAVGSALAGQEVADDDLVNERKYHFRVHFRAYDLTEYNPYDFCRVEYPQIVSSVLPMPTISKDRDRFDQPMTITLRTDVPKAEIRYTTDGSMPNEKSPLYKKPFVIGNSTYVKAKTYLAGATPSFTTIKRFNFDYIVNAKYSNKPNTPYNYNPESILFDGETGDISELSHGWLGFSGNNLDVVLELSKAIELQQVVVSFAHVPDAWAFAPTAVQVYVSEDGENYSQAINAKLKYAPEEQSMNTPQKVKVIVEVNQTDVKYVRLVAKNMGRIPSWHKARGLRPWIMVDEIELEEAIK